MLRMTAVYDNGPLSLAVLAGDSQQVDYLLKNHPATLRERNIMGQTPLHLAARNPACLRLLVGAADTAVINQADCNGAPVLTYAMRLSRSRCRNDGEPCSWCNCADSAVILLNADCAMNTGMESGLDILGRSSRRYRSRYLRHLKNRRERLKQLALKNLSILDHQRLKLQDGIVLDVHAPEAVRRLQERGVEIPEALAVDTLGFAYRRLLCSNFSHIPKPVAEAFYTLGFRNTDPFDNGIGDDETSLTDQLETEKPEYLHWLVEHGVELFRRLAPSSRACNAQLDQGVFTAHIVLFKAGCYMREKGFPKVEFGTLESLLTTILAVESFDNCRCKCSPEGCSPLTYMLKGTCFCWTYNDPEKHQWRDAFISSIPVLHSGWAFMDHLEIVRYMTFEALHITHTC